MPTLKPIEPVPRTVTTASAIRTVLVVDDSRAQRRLTVATLTKLGYDVIEADGGKEALAIAARTDVDMVLSDWMMPGMDGLELCRAFRQLPRDRYGYFMLLTSKSEKGAGAQGLDVGADDFLSKPINGEELRARIAAGDRILRMERELNEKNRLITATLEEISSLYDSLDRDLIEARKMQQALVRDRFRDFGAAQVSTPSTCRGMASRRRCSRHDWRATCPPARRHKAWRWCPTRRAESGRSHRRRSRRG